MMTGFVTVLDVGLCEGTVKVPWKYCEIFIVPVRADCVIFGCWDYTDDTDFKRVVGGGLWVVGCKSDTDSAMKVTLIVL